MSEEVISLKKPNKFKFSDDQEISKDLNNNSESSKKRLNFSITYLTIPEQIKLGIYFKMKMFLNNKKTLGFILSSPLVFCILLYLLNFLYISYSSTIAILNHSVVSISANDTISLKCTYPNDCISIGIVLLVYTHNY